MRWAGWVNVTHVPGTRRKGYLLTRPVRSWSWSRWTHLALTCLPAIWHNRPERIAPGVRRKIREARGEYARIFVLYGDCPCMVFGPVSESIHGFDERVNLESVKQVTKSIALFVADWCGVEEIP